MASLFGKRPHDAEREAFEKSLTTSIKKAVTSDETPTKIKHVRSTIIGTFQEKGGGTFWMVATNKLDLHSVNSQVMAWKFCHVLHKLLREGHTNVVYDSFKFMTYVTDLGRLWRQLTTNYGSLIGHYTAMLTQKLKFHKKWVKIPGNLEISDEQLNLVTGHGADAYFEFTIDLLDMMDEVLKLQKVVFRDVESNRTSTSMAANQCKLFPLIPCIQDTCQLYDYIVKMVFKLHKSIPADALAGHRSRFTQQYKDLKQFYFTCENLHYFKPLVKVPTLPEDPPNFLIAAEIFKHRKLKVVVRSEPVEDTPPPPPAPAPAVEDLVSVGNGETAASPIPAPDPRDSIIAQLRAQIEQLRAEKDFITTKAQEKITEMKRLLDEAAQRAALEAKKQEQMGMELAAVKRSLRESKEDNWELRQELEESRRGLEEKAEADRALDKAKSSDERYKKMRDIYENLREEHVVLLRKNANAERDLKREQEKIEEALVKAESVGVELERVKQEQAVERVTLEQSREESESQSTTLSAKLLGLEQNNQSMCDQLKELSAEKTLAEDETGKLQVECVSLHERLAALESGSETYKETTEAQLISIQEQLKASREEGERHKTSQEATSAKLTESEVAIASLTSRLSDTESTLTLAQTTLALAQTKLQEVEQVRGKVEEEKQKAGEEAAGERERAAQEAETMRKEAAELKERVSAVEKEIEEERKEKEKSVRAVEVEKALVVKSLDSCASDLERERSLVKEVEEERAKEREEGKVNESALRQRLLDEAIVEGHRIIKKSMKVVDGEDFIGNSASPEYLIDILRDLSESTVQLEGSSSAYGTDKDGLPRLIRDLARFSRGISDGILNGQATCNKASLEHGEVLSNACRAMGGQSLKLLEALKEDPSSDTVKSAYAEVRESTAAVLSAAKSLVPKTSDVSAAELGEMIGEEMSSTEKAIEEASRRMKDMLEESRKRDSGVKLEVNERILDSCTGLMASIVNLIRRSKGLQDEIVDQGRGASSMKEFYQRNHRWSEGLISAAKAVGWGANIMVEKAEKLVTGTGKFEEIIVCSREIAASTAQLVVASRVKADRESQRLGEVTTASREVSKQTGQVIASVTAGSERVEEQGLLDFSSLTLYQTKRLEMTSHVQIMELEAKLEKERKKISGLRKRHAHLAEIEEEEQQKAAASTNGTAGN